MRPASWMFAGVVMGCLTVRGASPQPSLPIIPSDPDAAGCELAVELLAIRPTESITNQAVLGIKARGQDPVEVPVIIETRTSDGTWSMTYRTTGTNQDHVTTFTVMHNGSRPSEYRVTQGTNETVLPGAKAFVPFAASDFWLADLGMEFLHWPTQRLLRKELCRSQSCNKLESIAPPGQSNGYVRVVSWFDIDTGGPVLCHAYDTGGKMVKEFKPNDFKKVDGQWQVEELEISNLHTRSRTTLRFQLDGR